MDSNQTFAIGFVGLFWFIAIKGWQMHKEGRIDAVGKPYLYLLTAILGFITLVWLLRAINLQSVAEFVMGAVVVVFTLQYVVQLLRFLGWGSILRGVIVLVIICWIGSYLYNQQQKTASGQPTEHFGANPATGIPPVR